MNEVVFKPMIVEGVGISADEVKAAHLDLRRERTFTFRRAQRSFIVAGVNPDIADRVADRHLQQQRKAGRIAHKGGIWSWL